MRSDSGADLCNGSPGTHRLSPTATELSGAVSSETHRYVAIVLNVLIRRCSKVTGTHSDQSALQQLSAVRVIPVGHSQWRWILASCFRGLLARSRRVDHHRLHHGALPPILQDSVDDYRNAITTALAAAVLITAHVLVATAHRATAANKDPFQHLRLCVDDRWT